MYIQLLNTQMEKVEFRNVAVEILKNDYLFYSCFKITITSKKLKINKECKRKLSVQEEN